MNEKLLFIYRTNKNKYRNIENNPDYKKDEYTHAAILLDKDFHRMYSFGRRKYLFLEGYWEEHLPNGL